MSIKPCADSTLGLYLNFILRKVSLNIVVMEKGHLDSKPRIEWLLRMKQEDDHHDFPQNSRIQ
ncbi:MAG: hypothetical protein PHI74_00605 [Methanocellales archaeon]|nr:hypothetical protein [Methanocellales archaeon]MDD3291224.1 hypothetical protein [Methanocellales archaeon]MDD5484521.1 hypothetical protein [Methanocellales archaeon]